MNFNPSKTYVKVGFEIGGRMESTPLSAFLRFQGWPKGKCERIESTIAEGKTFVDYFGGDKFIIVPLYTKV